MSYNSAGLDYYRDIYCTMIAWNVRLPAKYSQCREVLTVFVKKYREDFVLQANASTMVHLRGNNEPSRFCALSIAWTLREDRSSQGWIKSIAYTPLLVHCTIQLCPLHLVFHWTGVRHFCDFEVAAIYHRNRNALGDKRPRILPFYTQSFPANYVTSSKL